MVYALIALGVFCLVTAVLVMVYGKTKRHKTSMTPCPLCDTPGLAVDQDGSFACGACGVTADVMAVAPREVMEIHYRWRKMSLLDFASAGELVQALEPARTTLRETLTELLAESDAAARSGNVDAVREALVRGRRVLETAIVSEGKAAMQAHSDATVDSTETGAADTAGVQTAAVE